MSSFGNAARGVMLEYVDTSDGSSVGNHLSRSVW